MLLESKQPLSASYVELPHSELLSTLECGSTVLSIIITFLHLNVGLQSHQL